MPFLTRSTLFWGRSICPNSSTRAIAALKPIAVSTPSIQPFTTSTHSKASTLQQDSLRTRRQASSPSLSMTSSRNASTSTEPAPSSSSSAAPAQPTLNWNEFLRLRRIRRFYNLGGSVAMGVTGLISGVGTLATEDIGGWGAQMFGLDPFIIMGIFTTGCAGVGWLMGPLVGTSVFNLFYRRFSAQMRSKERDFFERIKRYRVDPTSSSMQNPVPDYYGEKITSVAGYRRWLKDQRAFNKKRTSFV